MVTKVVMGLPLLSAVLVELDPTELEIKPLELEVEELMAVGLVGKSSLEVEVALKYKALEYPAMSSCKPVQTTLAYRN